MTIKYGHIALLGCDPEDSVFQVACESHMHRITWFSTGNASEQLYFLWSKPGVGRAAPII
jgi:hypothetical protein